MTPSVSQLLGWRPADLVAVGEVLLGQAVAAERAAGELAAVGAELGQVWLGQTASAATAHIARRSGEVDALAAVLHSAGLTLQRAGELLSVAQAGLRAALAQADAAGCKVAEDGTFIPLAPSPVPPRMVPTDLAALQTERDAAEVRHAALAAGIAGRIRAVLQGAGQIDDATGAALRSLQIPSMSAPPRPVAMGPSGGLWGTLPGLPVVPPPAKARAKDENGGFWQGLGHQVSGLGHGVVDGVVEPVKMISGLVGLNGDRRGHWNSLFDGLKHDMAHPRDFGEALVGWEDLAAGEYGHGLGELIPGAAAAVMTGGAGAAVRGTKVADDVADAARVSHAMGDVRRVEREVDGDTGTIDYMTEGRDLAVDTSRPGVASIGSDAVTARVASRVPATDQVFTLVTHGRPDGFHAGSAADVIDTLRLTHDGNPVCLFSCYAASNGTAQAVADALGVVVRAPTGRVGLPRFGPAIPRLEPGASWQSFRPRGD